MDFENKYRQELNKLRNNPELLKDYSIDSSSDLNKNQIRRNRILIALFNDTSNSDYEIAEFIFEEEQKLRKKSEAVEDYEVETLYLAAFILTQVGKVDTIWKFLDTKTIDFDSSIGFDLEYLFAFGVKETVEYVRNSNHLDKEELIKISGINNSNLPFSQSEIDEWKSWRKEYFSVFKFPIKDKIDFAFQAQEYEELKKEIPNWMNKINEWNEEQFLTSIAIGRILDIDELSLKAMKGYIEKFSNSVRIELYKKDIEKIEKRRRTHNKG